MFIVYIDIMYMTIIPQRRRKWNYIFIRIRSALIWSRLWVEENRCGLKNTKLQLCGTNKSGDLMYNNVRQYNTALNPGNLIREWIWGALTIHKKWQPCEEMGMLISWTLVIIALCIHIKILCCTPYTYTVLFLMHILIHGVKQFEG